MSMKKTASNNEEFDQRFDDGEDIHELVDMSRAEAGRPGKKVRITLDMNKSLVEAIDDIREGIGVDRGALIKVWLHERVQEEKGKR